MRGTWSQPTPKQCAERSVFCRRRGAWGPLQDHLHLELTCGRTFSDTFPVSPRETRCSQDCSLLIQSFVTLGSSCTQQPPPSQLPPTPLSPPTFHKACTHVCLALITCLECAYADPVFGATQ